MFILPNNATIIEVGPRDGLQNEGKVVSTEHKLQFIERLQKAGIQEMELTSFVSPKWVPQMADAKDIMANVEKIGRQFVLTPNEKGINAALESGAQAVAVFVGVSNTFNKKNINKTTDESMEALKPLILKLKQDGVFVRACISTAFYCPFEGAIKPEDTLALCHQFVDWGVDELSVADTIGMATPAESYELFQQLKEAFPDVLLTAHFHDTRKMALANIFAALQAGVDRFDSSAGGLGGCPFAPGATGNVATEDVVNMLNRMGIETGINLDLLCEAVQSIEPHVTNPVQTGMYRLYQNQA
ncbi:hydroxymethylglutaryl-CoA lyase [Planococcus shenhongbingii]|uniref:Hydroxymethylglutaryl-CoA lyase n=1 Tax=Planococcus shenhongbingii TaxID=3058398 RepID=A0ABT8N8C0_9BACL|nr:MULTISPECIES: hydroxymethylglutaryl-CoA lyase [unclassified Planococcus (in: firmicutes)]MDN7244124.1 hydroxymethylglutaryl-CoA lyase [Planococcus sp. N017]WKA57300.1 hydroxymethylglutaryl-CoA lyase [Planococcus sp. N016]